jgi:putative ATPase
MVNWNATTLKTMFAKLDLVCELQQESQTTQIYISPQLIKRWFTPAKTRPAYIDHLSFHLTAPEIHQIQQLFEQQLQNKQVPWRSTLLWITKN